MNLDKKLSSFVLFCVTCCFASEYSDKNMRNVYQASFRIHAYSYLKHYGNDFYNLHCKNNKGIFNSATKVIGKAVSDILTNNNKDYFYDKKHNVILFKVSPIDVNYTISNTNALLLWNMVSVLFNAPTTIIKDKIWQNMLDGLCERIQCYYNETNEINDIEFADKLKSSSQQVIKYIKTVRLTDYIGKIRKNMYKKSGKFLKNMSLTIII